MPVCRNFICLFVHSFCENVFMCIYMFMSVHEGMCVYEYMCMCLYLNVCMCMYVDMCADACVCTCVSLCVHVCVQVSAYGCVNMGQQVWLLHFLLLSIYVNYDAVPPWLCICFEEAINAQLVGTGPEPRKPSCSVLAVHS